MKTKIEKNQQDTFGLLITDVQVIDLPLSDYFLRVFTDKITYESPIITSGQKWKQNWYITVSGNQHAQITIGLFRKTERYQICQGEELITIDKPGQHQIYIYSNKNIQSPRSKNSKSKKQLKITQNRRIAMIQFNATRVSPKSKDLKIKGFDKFNKNQQSFEISNEISRIDRRNQKQIDDSEYEICGQLPQDTPRLGINHNHEQFKKNLQKIASKMESFQHKDRDMYSGILDRQDTQIIQNQHAFKKNSNRYLKFKGRRTKFTINPTQLYRSNSQLPERIKQQQSSNYQMEMPSPRKRQETISAMPIFNLSNFQIETEIKPKQFTIYKQTNNGNKQLVKQMKAKNNYQYCWDFDVFVKQDDKHFAEVKGSNEVLKGQINPRKQQIQLYLENQRNYVLSQPKCMGVLKYRMKQMQIIETKVQDYVDVSDSLDTKKLPKKSPPEEIEVHQQKPNPLAYKLVGSTLQSIVQLREKHQTYSQQLNQKKKTKRQVGKISSPPLDKKQRKQQIELHQPKILRSQPKQNSRKISSQQESIIKRLKSDDFKVSDLRIVENSMVESRNQEEQLSGSSKDLFVNSIKRRKSMQKKDDQMRKYQTIDQQLVQPPQKIQQIHHYLNNHLKIQPIQSIQIFPNRSPKKLNIIPNVINRTLVPQSLRSNIQQKNSHRFQQQLPNSSKLNRSNPKSKRKNKNKLFLDNTENQRSQYELPPLKIKNYQNQLPLNYVILIHSIFVDISDSNILSGKYVIINIGKQKYVTQTLTCNQNLQWKGKGYYFQVEASNNSEKSIYKYLDAMVMEQAREQNKIVGRMSCNLDTIINEYKTSKTGNGIYQSKLCNYEMQQIGTIVLGFTIAKQDLKYRKIKTDVNNSQTSELLVSLNENPRQKRNKSNSKRRYKQQQQTGRDSHMKNYRPPHYHMGKSCQACNLNHVHSSNVRQSIHKKKKKQLYEKANQLLDNALDKTQKRRLRYKSPPYVNEQ